MGQMAYYKYAQFLKKQEGLEFDVVHEPGAVTPYSGLYRCEVCGLTATMVRGRHIPPETHHQHPARARPMRWRLAVKSHWA
jgi:hypothetical protein